MSQNCDCEIPAVELPVMGLKLSLPKSAFPEPSEPERCLRVWESDWFDIAPGTAFDFNHNLNLEFPFLCQPQIVGRPKMASPSGWNIGEILFIDGQNYLGSVSDQSSGNAISVDANSAHVAIGNAPSFVGTYRAGGSYSGLLPKEYVECKLVIFY